MGLVSAVRFVYLLSRMRVATTVTSVTTGLFIMTLGVVSTTAFVVI